MIDRDYLMSLGINAWRYLAIQEQIQEDMTHEQLIAACFQWHWNERPEERRMLYGVNNNISEGLLNYVPKVKRPTAARMEGNKNKAKGVVPGVFDLCYVLPRKCCWLDAKVGNDKPSPEQLDFMTKVMKRGHLAIFFSTLEEFQNIINTLSPRTVRN